MYLYDVCKNININQGLLSASLHNRVGILPTGNKTVESSPFFIDISFYDEETKKNSFLLLKPAVGIMSGWCMYVML